MSIPRYERYQESANSPLLKQIPAQWRDVALKHAAEVLPSNVDKKSVEGEASVRLCNYTDVYYHNRIVDLMTFMVATASDAQIARLTLQGGDVVITKDSETADDIGRSALVPETLPGVVCGYHLSIVRPRSGVQGAFLKYYFDSTVTRAELETRANGLTRVAIGQMDTDSLPLALPPEKEQSAIALFLDRETATIDALITEEERLIALLQEKRQAVISHTVTKGLDPNVPMKESGVEWIGDIPGHWTVARTGRAFRSIGSGSTPPSDNSSYYDEVGVEWVNTGDLPDGPINTVARRVSSEAVSKFTTLREYPAGAVVIAMYGATIGKLGILTRPAVVNQACCVLSDGDGVAEPFLFHALLAAREAIIQLATGGTQPNISQATVRAFQIPVPPIEEQRILVARLEAALSRIDALVNDAAAMTTLLRERRTALITAAVTGQIDVRGLIDAA